MRQLPPCNNVYGFLYASNSLERVAEVIRSRLGFTKTEVYVYKSQFDGSEELHIKTEGYEFDVRKAQTQDTWLIDGCVAGDGAEIVTVLKLLSSHLHWAGYTTKFEIYDEQFNWVADYP